MYGAYAYFGGKPIRDIWLDTVALLTGTTNKNSLSTACDKLSTEIFSSVDVAGWTLVPEAKTFDAVQTDTISTLSQASELFYSPTANKFLNILATGAVGYSADTLSFTTAGTAASVIKFADNGSAVFALRGASSNTGYKSTDAATWTAPTTSSSSGLTGIAGGNGIFMAIGTGVVSLSLDNGDVWAAGAGNIQSALGNVAYRSICYGLVAGTTPTFLITGTLCSTTTTDNAASYSPTKSMPINGDLTAYGNGRFVAVALSSATSASLPDGSSAWISGSLPFTMAATGQLRFDSTNNIFVLSGGSNKLAFSVDGLNWMSKAFNATFTSTCLAIKNGEARTISTIQTTKYLCNYLSGTFKAPYDTPYGTVYKYVHLCMGNGAQNRLFLRGFESAADGVWRNKCYFADDATIAQQIDLANGGIIYIWASARRILLLSYLPNGTVWGSASSGWSVGAVEYTRDDPYADGNWPSFGVFHGAIGTNNFMVPRIKSNFTTELVGANAYLTLAPDYALTKPAFDSSGLSTAQMVRSMRVYSNAPTSNVLVGGIVYGIEQTTDSYGTTLSELDISGLKYVLIANGTNRMVLPKG